MKTTKKLLIIFLLLTTVSGVYAGDERVLTIYFAGTTMTRTNNFGWGDEHINSELISTLFHNDQSEEIFVESDYIGPFEDIIWRWFFKADKDIDRAAPKYKVFIDGIGVHSGCKLCKADGFSTGLDCRTYYVCKEEAAIAFKELTKSSRSTIDSEDLIVNLVGFSRGGVLTMEFTNWLYVNNKSVKKINIMAFDPVPGVVKGNPLGKMSGTFDLRGKNVDQFVGIYAEDERSYRFEPVLPQFDSDNGKFMLYSVRGSHETMVGNVEVDGHPGGTSIQDARLESVYEISWTIAQRLLTGSEWGSLTLLDNEQFAGNDAKSNFLGAVESMTEYGRDCEFDHYRIMQWFTFVSGDWLAELFIDGEKFQAVDREKYKENLCYQILKPARHAEHYNKEYGINYSRLMYKFPYLSSEEEVVFFLHQRDFFGYEAWFHQEVKPDIIIVPLAGRAEAAWDRMERLRSGDFTPPVPNIDPLPDLRGECQAEITEVPTATDAVVGTITGTTIDPLLYTEQGEYMVTWVYDDGNGNTATQTQAVVVKDDTPPVIESISATPSVLWPPNHKMVKVRIELTASDNCDSAPVSRITGIVCNESGGSRGAGNKAPDWLITGNLIVRLRADRSGNGSGRVYEITVECADKNGNSSTETVFVRVQHQQAPQALQAPQTSQHPHLRIKVRDKNIPYAFCNSATLPSDILADDITLSFISQSGATHFVECRTNLLVPPWIPITNFPGDGTEMQVTLPATNPTAIYRIQTK